MTKTDFTYTIDPFDFFLLRTPLLPIHTILELNGQCRTTPLPVLTSRLFQDPLIEESIYTASPELHDELKRFIDNKTSDKSSTKLQLSLYKYFLRMSSRCTPFGLFAGYAMGKVSDAKTSFILQDKEAFSKFSRLDISCIKALVNKFQEDKHIRDELILSVNNSLYPVNDKLRYIETVWKHHTVNYILNSVDRSVYLERILHHAEKGFTAIQLADLLADEELSREELLDFIEELIGHQILLRLEPAITGDDYLHTLTQFLRTVPGQSGLVGTLEEIAIELDGQAKGIVKYKKIFALLQKILPDIDPKNIIQTDLHISTHENNMELKEVVSIGEDIRQLIRLRRKAENISLKKFKQKFTTRFGEQEVPLLQALDVDSGIGYGESDGNLVASPFLETLPLGGTGMSARNPVLWNSTHDLKLKIVIEALTQHKSEIILSEEDIQKYGMPETEINLPSSFYVFGSLLKNHAFPETYSSLFLLKGCSGPSACNLISRFCSGDNELTEKIRECLKEEGEQETQILAEIVHLPQGRIGNVITRPCLREYEITFLGVSGKPKEYQIPINDLMVSIQNNEIILRSKRLNKRIIPRLTTAHNFENDRTIAYRFLGDLQYQDTEVNTYWDWEMFSNQPFLPRIRLGRTIVSRAGWILTEEDIRGIPAENQEIMLEKMARVRKERKIPQLVVISQFDNELLIDLACYPALLLLFKEVQKLKRVRLIEFLELPENCLAKGSDGNHCNEIILPFKAVPVIAKPSTVVFKEGHAFNSGPKYFYPGSSWIYYKVYCGTATAEMILREKIDAVVQDLLGNQEIEKFFFIRYQDPEPHLRLRFYHNKKADFSIVVTRRLFAALHPLVESGLITNVQSDLYAPEYDRYGIKTMECSENIFFHDSIAVLNFLRSCEDDQTEAQTWLFAIAGVDEMLNDFGYTLQGKHGILYRLHGYFLKEFGGSEGSPLNRALNDRFRKSITQLEELLNGRKEEALSRAAWNILKQRSSSWKPDIASIKKVLATGNEGIEEESFIQSYLHMFLNRLFTVGQRAHELVIYHYLEKFYRSRIAREKFSQIQPGS